MPPDRNLDRELRDLGAHVEYPPTPDLARSVRGRLEAGDGSAGSPSRTGPGLWWIAAAALVLLLALPAFAAVLNGMGGALSGGAGVAGGGAESGGQDAAGSAERGSSRPTSAAAGPSSDPPSPAEAACARPEPALELRPARGGPGEELRLRGRHFVAGFGACDDAPPETSAQTVPAGDVGIEFRQGGKTWKLGSVRADGRSRLSAEFEVPADARPGRATVRAVYGGGADEPPYNAPAEARFFVLD